MTYQCTLVRGSRKERWQGEIRLISYSNACYEAEIRGRGTYFHVIAGRHRYGNYICIPNHDVGSELSEFRDLFWNSERLSGLMRKVDALTVSQGLCYLEELAFPEKSVNN